MEYPNHKNMTEEELKEREHLLSDEISCNEEEVMMMEDEIDAIYAELDSRRLK